MIPSITFNIHRSLPWCDSATFKILNNETDGGSGITATASARTPVLAARFLIFSFRNNEHPTFSGEI
jgi:hypothetical protein